MEQQLATLYNKLADKIISMIPVKWNKIYYLGEVEKGKLSWSSVFYFEEINSKEIVKSHGIPEKYNVSEKIYDELLDELDVILIEIYDCFIKNNQEPWEQLSFELDMAGKFKIDYLYNKISNTEDDQLQREIIWAYETFDFKPKEGSYTRKILEKYIANKK
ncbi:antitoxin YezG family protein [Cellulosilyticum lentocellum]|uniref:Uncharacterized protein n=1 Tax=Cellulosilyticum lentocellum (strain ATCC 49066 / DSM 5427 / NCIMB 11756 / RHM5) TaxID=642492 RepID=F2JHQ5_CELLD|nr:antitoxin YezG family protein [Cellulosilyticum lentocellum]ADZ85397.1 protein of unknown function DUF600 [Cellulosilyticum lentocellum DSM 5427]